MVLKTPSKEQLYSHTSQALPFNTGCSSRIPKLGSTFLVKSMVGVKDHTTTQLPIPGDSQPPTPHRAGDWTGLGDSPPHPTVSGTGLDSGTAPHSPQGQTLDWTRGQPPTPDRDGDSTALGDTLPPDAAGLTSGKARLRSPRA